MGDLLHRLGVSLPIAQAGMGEGIAGHRLAAAVSEAGGLGTIGILDPPRLREELTRARQLTGRPLAINLLLPFARAGHWKVAADADAVITFWGRPVRHTDGVWIHQCGALSEIEAATAAGVDGVIVQGLEAGGHVRGALPALELLTEARARWPSLPLLAAGGVAEAEDVRRAVDAGAEGVVAGTRFLLSEESSAHPEYQRRLLAADRTVLTTLFGLGWPAPHRVVPNAATERWLRGSSHAPVAARLAGRLTAPVGRRLPVSVASGLARRQRLFLPWFGPLAPLTDSPARLVDVSPLYAGESVKRMDRIAPAAELVRRLAS